MMIIGIVFFWVIPTAVFLWLLYNFVIEFRKDRIPILLYHRLISKADAESGNVKDEEMIYVSYDEAFKQQMNYLKESDYETLSLDDYVQIRAKNKSMPEKAVVITLDDGYLSNYKYAYPALKENNQKATIFVAPQPDEYTVNNVKDIDAFLSNEQMIEMSENNISIESHTLTHRILTDLTDEEIEFELTESKKLPLEYYILLMLVMHFRKHSNSHRQT